MDATETGGPGDVGDVPAGGSDPVHFLVSGECDEVRFVGPQYEALWGQSATALRDDPTTFLDGIHPADRAAVVEGVARLRDGEPVTLDCRINPDEEYGRTVRIRGDPVHDEDGTVGEIVATAREVADDAACCAARERYRTLLRNIPDGVYLFDEDGVLQFVNRAAVAASDATREEFLGSTVTELLREASPDQEAVDSALEEHQRLVAGEQEELRRTLAFGVGDDRTPFAVRSARGYGDDGEFVGVVSVLRDISDRVAAEKELTRQNERLDEFASVVSHDLRNPLNVAAARLDLARQECDSDHLDEVAWAHDRMADLIEDILTVARVGGAASAFEPVGLAAIARRCWDGVPTGDATLVVDTDRRIRADRSRLRQLLENLVRNTVEHGSTSPGSAASRGDAVERGVTVTVGTLSDGFYVADDGPGIPESERDRVFDSGYTTTADGTGFGLHIVAQVAEAHGWDVRATESESGGARFEFTGVEFVGE
jgi:PAS domain S-box-containing protein